MMQALRLSEGILTKPQLEKALCYVERQVFKNPDDVSDVDEVVDGCTVEVFFDTYANSIDIAADSETGEPMAYLFDADGDLLDTDTDIFVTRIRAMLCEANDVHDADLKRAKAYAEEQIF